MPKFCLDLPARLKGIAEKHAPAKLKLIVVHFVHVYCILIIYSFIIYSYNKKINFMVLPLARNEAGSVQTKRFPRKGYGCQP